MTDKTGGKCKTSRKLGKGYSENDKRKEIEWNKARFKRIKFLCNTYKPLCGRWIKWYSNHVQAFNMCLIEYVALDMS